MDKKMDQQLKRAWQSIMGNLKPAMATTCVSRNMESPYYGRLTKARNSEFFLDFFSCCSLYFRCFSRIFGPALKKKSIYFQHAVPRLQNIVFGSSSRKLLYNKPAKGLNKGPGYEEPIKGFDASKGCDTCISRGMLSGILFSHIPDKKAIRKLPFDSQLETIEQVSPIQEVLYGLDLHGQKYADQGMLYGINRPERCLPTYSYSTSIPEVGGQYGEGGATSAIQGPSLRPFISSASLYKSYGRSPHPSSPSGDCGNPISGRPPLLCPSQRSCKNLGMILARPAVIWSPWVGQ